MDTWIIDIRRERDGKTAKLTCELPCTLSRDERDAAFNKALHNVDPFGDFEITSARNY